MPALAIGIVYDLFGSYPLQPDAPADAEAEYEPEATLRALEGAVRRLGHRPLRLGNAHELLAWIAKGEHRPIDVALNIAEGRGSSRNREAWAPVLLEMAGIPSLGSDALTLSLSLDKAWAKSVVAAAGVRVPPQRSIESREAAENAELPGQFPLFVKPRWEGSAKGIGPSSRVEDRAALAREVARIVETYAQPALVEPFLAGPEYTVTVVGSDPPRALPVLQRAVEDGTRIGLHALERHAPPGGGWTHRLSGSLDPALEKRLAEQARTSFRALECRDFARADFRLDGDGEPAFLEMNPLPTFAPDGSFGVLAELEGVALEELLAGVIEGGLARLGLA